LTGALKNFLDSLGSTWSITLFHYRNYGSDVGKVLAGFSLPRGQEEKFQDFLAELKYHYVEETENPVYQQFMR
jgi:threonine dehydratase